MNAPQAAKPRHWAQINESSFVTGMRILFWICKVFGRWPFRVVLYPVLLWYVLAKPNARRASQQFLERAGACGAPVTPGLLTVTRHFAALAESILDKMLLWGGLFDTDQALVFGDEAIHADLDAGRGGLLMCSHLGNLDLCRVLAKRRAGFTVTVLVYSRHAQAFGAVLAQLDPDSALNLMSVAEITPATAMVLADKIARGEFVVIAGDRTPVAVAPRVSWASFLGRPAPFPVGAYVLASLLKCPVYLVFSLRVGASQRPEIHFERFRDAIDLPRKGRDEAIAALVADYVRRLEYFSLQAPLQWFNFYDFWHLPTLDTSDASR